MRLDARSRELLGSARIGMLALAAGRHPLVNPAAFSYVDGSIWMTTSRFAAKIGLARRNPRAAFLVDGGDRTVLLQGLLEVFDLRSVAGGLRALLVGPGLALGIAGYAAKNAAFIGGYLIDVAGVPAEWWPHNRVVMRLQPVRARTMQSVAVKPSRRQVPPGVPRAVARAVAGSPAGYLSWLPRGGFPNLAPVMWARGGDDMLAWLPGALAVPAGGVPGALVVEHHHRFRAQKMVGVCVRGEMSPDPGAAAPVADRYRVDFHGGTPIRLHTRRVTTWTGFKIETRALPGRRPQAGVST